MFAHSPYFEIPGILIHEQKNMLNLFIMNYNNSSANSVWTTRTQNKNFRILKYTILTWGGGYYYLNNSFTEYPPKGTLVACLRWESFFSFIFFCISFFCFYLTSHPSRSAGVFSISNQLQEDFYAQVFIA